MLVTPLSKLNEDECFDPCGDVNEIELLLHRDPSAPKISVASILEGFTDEPSLEKNDDLFDLESKEDEWMKILYDAPTDDLMTEDKVFDPEIPEKFFSLTYIFFSKNDKDDDSEHEADDDMGYNPSNVAFIEWLASKIFNYKTMDHYTMKALWIYWIRGDDEVELTEEESSDDEDEIAEGLRPIKITKMTGSMNGIKMYHGCTTSHGLIMEHRKSQHQSNIHASLSIIRRMFGMAVVGEMKDTVIEDTYPELTLLETNSIIRITNASNEEIDGPITDQPISAYASPTALSPGYISSDDDNDDDVEKDEEDEEEEEHLAPA
ncbi:hypothetical protein Tco_1363236, partial [Tanacetum coccineum]